MALDVTGTLLTGIKDALAARPSLVILPGNLIVTSSSGWLNAFATRRLPNDFPCVLIYATGDSAMTTPQRPFGIGSDECDYPKKMTVTVEVRVVFDKIYDAGNLPVEAEINAGLMSTDQSLRESALRPAPMDWRKSRTTQPFNGSVRTVVIWTTTAECRPYYSTLTA